VPARLIHVSDLHFGAHDRTDVEAPLRALVERISPDLVVATGDITHRGRREQHAQAAELLHGLGAPLLVVPGNHDIPLLPPARFTRPWAAFEEQWQTTTPVHRSDELLVVGVNSVRPWRHQSGGLAEAAVAAAERELASGSPGALRAVCLHHQLGNAPWRTRKRPLARRGDVLERIAAAGAELVLSGHVHQAGVADRREFAVLDGQRPVVVATAAGLTRPRPRRLGEAEGAHVVTVEEDWIAVETYVFHGGGFERVAERRFRRG
jgi:3',5'-cyclic AMP phosphodiesterase CpdA